ncbi:MAG: LuxR C-terminal-related transcriptional regulator [Dehalococcoidia bacterium]
MDADTDPSCVDHTSAAHEALARGTWELARSWFEEALAREETPAALEGLGLAAWWGSDAATAFDAHGRAYRLYRAIGDRRGAARMATMQAFDHFSFRGEYAICNGWFQRAHRLLDGLDPCPEHALLAIWEGYVALAHRHDTDAVRRLSEQATTIARLVGATDLEMLALALEGLGLVGAGEVDEGMRRLDEAAAAAVAGELSDFDAIGTIFCFLISACEQVGDYDRAVQWCATVTRVTARWSERLLFSLCRTHYAGVLIWRGAWPEAEAELVTATNDLAAVHPAMAAEAIARLAELRRRQGRPVEAAALFRQVESQPLRRLAGRFTLLGRAALALDEADLLTADDLVERFLRGVQHDDRMERASGLELRIRVHIATGDHAGAAVALEELRSVAGSGATDPLRGPVLCSEGLVATAAMDHETARHRFEDAVDVFERSGTPFEAARARVELACVLAKLGRPQAARTEAMTAKDSLQRLGAVREAERAVALLRSLEEPAHGAIGDAFDPVGLTPRECEVLRLVAAGRSNQEIAEELVVSTRTVERHISTIYEKLGANGRVARAVATAYAVNHGIA